MGGYKILAGTYSDGENGGIFYGNISEDGKITAEGNIPMKNPSYLALSENKKYVYAVSETNDGEALSFSLEDNSPRSKVKVNGASPCHILLLDEYMIVSNYSSGSLSVMDTTKGGSVLPSFMNIVHYGQGVNKNRQEKAHIHSASLTPDKKYIAVCDLGIDKVVLYKYSSEYGLSIKHKAPVCPPGSGPRHAAFSPDGKFMYVNAEMGNEVLVYAYGNGNASLIQRASTLAEDFTGRSNTAAIKFSPDGTLLAVSNRGEDSVVLYTCAENGLVKFKSRIYTEKTPRDFSFTPDGNFIIAANQDSQSLTVHRLDGSLVSRTDAVPSPVCILVF